MARDSAMVRFRDAASARLTPLVRRVARPLFARLTEPSRVLFNPYVSGKLLPLQTGAGYAIVPRRRAPAADAAGADALPVPPRALWEGYGETEAEYLASGQEDMDAMLRILEQAGAAPGTFTRVLEFGCAAARMLRFFPRGAGDGGRAGVALWGVDVKAKHVAWCQQHLPPPFAFAATTTAPHLPFEDNYFDFVYCGSVFTHISDTADAWLLELRRIVRPGGHVYVTVHDKHSVELLFTTYKDRADFQFLRDMLLRVDAEASLLSADYAYAAIGTEPVTQVFYDRDYLVEKWGAFMTVASVTPEAYGYQTALLLRK